MSIYCAYKCYVFDTFVTWYQNNTANEAFERVASYGLLPNMIFYLMKEYNLGLTVASNMLFYWSAATNFLPILGAFLSDSYLGRFLTICLGCIVSFLVRIFPLLLFFLTLGGVFRSNVSYLLVILGA